MEEQQALHAHHGTSCPGASQDLSPAAHLTLPTRERIVELCILRVLRSCTPGRHALAFKQQDRGSTAGPP